MEEEKKFRVIDKKEKPIEVEIAEFLISKGIYTLEQVKELLEPNFFAVIPLSILEKKTISANAKLLYAEILALSKKSGKCFATSEYIADRLGLKKDTIRGLLRELQDDMLVKVDVERNKKGTYREIRLTAIGIVGGELNNAGGVVRITQGGWNKQRIQKRNRQKEIDKENNNRQGKALRFSNKKEIDSLIDAFKEINPSYERLFGNTTERAAIERLVKKYGQEMVKKMIKGLKSIFGQPYAPTITTPYLLEKKLADYISYLQKRSKEKINFIDFTKL